MTTERGLGAMVEHAHARPPALRICGATDVGLRRDQNEDTFLIADLRSGEISSPCAEVGVSLSESGYLLLVCDGMGGAAAGEVAAAIAAASIHENLVHAGDVVPLHPRESLKEAVAVADRAIHDEAQAKPEERGMGTTCTAAILMPGRLTVAQVGDSRAYLLRAGKLIPLTKDQSWAAQMVASGALTPDQVRTFPYRNVLLQVLGTKGHIDPVMSDYQLLPGDRVLLCSDGLHGPVTDADIETALSHDSDLAAAIKILVDRALAAGGPDNVTVVVADYLPS